MNRVGQTIQYEITFKGYENLKFYIKNNKLCSD